MIITTWNGKSFDTDKDLTAIERHIIQKLFAWGSLVTSLNQFRQEKTDAFLKGWNDSGPVNESAAMQTIIRDLEKKVIVRLNTESP